MRYPGKGAWPYVLAILGCFALTHSATGAKDVPFVPTPQPVVDKMLELAEVDGKDLVYDLGSGDGRIVVTAAKRYGARGIGVDIDPERIAEGRENARRAGVEDKVSFVEGDLFDVDLRPATAVTLYLLPSVNLRLRPKLFKELRPGTPVVSHSFAMGDWEPERTEVLQGSTIYLWRIPARAAGRWDYRIVHADGRIERHTLDVTQQGNKLEGTLSVDGRAFPVRNGRVGVDEISFSVDRPVRGRIVTQYFKGRVIDERVAGMALLAERAVARRDAVARHR